MLSEKELIYCFDLHYEIFEKIPMPLVIIDPKDSQIIYINEDCANRLGYLRREIMGRSLHQLNIFQPGKLKEFIRIILAKGEYKNYEISFNDGMGKSQYGFISGSTIDIMNQRYIMIAYDDMKGKVLDSSTQSLSEARVLNIFNNQDSILWMKDLNGRYLIVNKSFLDFCGRQFSEVINKTDLELWNIDTAERLRQFDNHTISTKSHESILQTIQTKNGVKKLVIINVPLLSDTGTPQGTAGYAFIMQDQILPKLEDYKFDGQFSYVNRLFIDSQQAGNVGSWHLNMQSREIWFSLESYRILNIEAGIPFNFDMLLSCVVEIDKPRLKHAFLIEDRQEPIECEFRVMKDKNIRWLNMRGALRINEGGIYATGTVQDVTDRREMEEALRISKEKLDFTKNVLNSSQELGKIGSFYFNYDTKYLWWSPGMYKIFEMPEDKETDQNTFFTLLHSEDKAVLNQIKTSWDDAVPFMFDHRICSNGVVKWVCTKATVQYAQSGVPQALIGTIIDITQRKKEEEEINQARKKMQIMDEMLLRSQKAGNVGSWMLNFKNNRIWASDETFSIFGIEKNAHLSPEIMFGYIYEQDREDLAKAYEAGIEKEYFSMEFRIRRYGEICWLLCKGIVEKDKKGVPQKIMGTVVDITERKKVEIKLQKSEEKFRTVADWTYTWEYWLSPYNKILYISPSCERISGYTKDEFLKNNKLLFDIVHPDDKAMVLKHIESVANLQKKNPMQKDARSIEYRIFTKQNELRWIEHISRGVYAENGKFLGRRVSNRDITQVKEAEEINRELIKAKEIEALRTEFFANISHELRMPLTIIFSSLQLIQPVLEDNTQIAREFETIKKHNGYIRQNTYRLMKLVNNLIDITKIDSGCMQLLTQHCDIVDVVRQVVHCANRFILEKGIDISFHTDVKELWLQCDADKIERILLNLLSNATKFNTPGGSIMIRFKTRRQRFLIEVEDTGEGIEKSKQAAIFERFRQADNSFTRRHEGSGTGLSIVKMLLDLMGGTICVQSDPGVGSIFILEIPMELNKQQYSLSRAHGMIWYPKEFSVNVEFSDIYS